MGFFGDIVRGLIHLICGSQETSTQPEPPTQEPYHPRPPVSVPPQRPPSKPYHQQRPEQVPVSHPPSPPQKQRPTRLPVGQCVARSFSFTRPLFALG